MHRDRPWNAARTAKQHQKRGVPTKKNLDKPSPKSSEFFNEMDEVAQQIPEEQHADFWQRGPGETGQQSS